MATVAKKLFVGGLPYATTDEELSELFSSYGSVSSARVVRDRETNRSKGFGFVEFEDDSAADSAKQALDGSDYQGRRLVVDEARPRDDRPAR